MSSQAHSRRPARELGLAAIFFLVVTILMTWPQAVHLADGLTDVGDAKLVTRTLQWDFSQTFRDPRNLYQLNFFHPARYVLAFSENLYGVSLFGFPLLALGASALANYNTLLLLGMFLSALAAWALARQITGDPVAAIVAGLVFAFLPWRFSQLPHLQFQWSAFLCLALLFLLRYLEGGRRRDAWLFAVSLAWNALCNVHYALFSGFLVVLTLVVFALQGGPERSRRAKGAILAAALGWLAFVPFALPYREASRLYGMRRYLGEVRQFSGRWSDFLSAGQRNQLYGQATARWSAAEGDFFPGLLPVALAGACLVLLWRAGERRPAALRKEISASARRLARILDVVALLLAAAWIGSRLRPGLRVGPLHLGDSGRVLVFLTIAVVLRLFVAFPSRARSATLADFVRSSRLGWKALLFLALGVTGIVVALGARTPYYRFLFQSFGSLFQSIRAPSRGIVLFHLALAVFGAWGLALLLRGRRLRARLGWTALAAAVLVGEYRAFPLTLVPTEAQAAPVYVWLSGFDLPGAVVEWPFGLIYDFEYVFRQTTHEKPILNGYSGFFPQTYTGLEEQLKQRPIPDSAWETMGRLGASLLIYHAHDRSGNRVAGYADALERALSEGRLDLVRDFPHGAGRDFVFVSAAATWRERAHAGAAEPEETRKRFDTALADLRRDVGQLSPPFGAIHLPKEGQEVAPGFWVHGWALDDSGIAEVRYETEVGPGGVAVMGGGWPGVGEAYPDYPEAATRSTYGFPFPEVADGPHTLGIVLVGKDGGVTTMRRAIRVVHPPPEPGRRP